MSRPLSIALLAPLAALLLIGSGGCKKKQAVIPTAKAAAPSQTPPYGNKAEVKPQPSPVVKGQKNAPPPPPSGGVVPPPPPQKVAPPPPPSLKEAMLVKMAKANLLNATKSMDAYLQSAEKKITAKNMKAAMKKLEKELEDDK